MAAEDVHEGKTTRLCLAAFENAQRDEKEIIPVICISVKEERGSARRF